MGMSPPFALNLTFLSRPTRLIRPSSSWLLVVIPIIPHLALYSFHILLSLANAACVTCLMSPSFCPVENPRRVSRRRRRRLLGSRALYHPRLTTLHDDITLAQHDPCPFLPHHYDQR